MEDSYLANLARKRNWAHRSIACMRKLLSVICDPFEVDTYWINEDLTNLQEKIDIKYRMKKASVLQRRKDDCEANKMKRSKW